MIAVLAELRVTDMPEPLVEAIPLAVSKSGIASFAIWNPLLIDPLLILCCARSRICLAPP